MDDLEKHLRELQHEYGSTAKTTEEKHDAATIGLAVGLVKYVNRFLWWLSPLAAAVIAAIWISNILAGEHVDHPENVFPIVLLALYRPTMLLKKKTDSM